MPAGDVLGSLLGGIAAGKAAKDARNDKRATATSLEDLNQRVGRGEMGPDFVGPMRPLGSRSKGGPINKTGFYLLHRGESVESAADVKKRKSARKTPRSSGRR
jgi:hypothetical protein